MSKFIPNSFQVPNVIVDEMMAVLGDTELRCYLLLIRKTTGWQKEMDFISNTQFQKYTGRGKTSITHALQKLQERGLVFELDSKEGTTNCYALNADQFTNWTGSKSEPVQKVNGGSSESERVPVQKVNTQKTNTKPTIQNTTTTTPAPAETHTAPAAYGDTPTLPTEAFAMHLDWQPQNLRAVNSLLRIAGLPMFDRNDANLNAAFADFVGFWFAKPDTLRTAREWDTKFVQSAVEYWRKHYCPHPAYQQRQDDWGQGEARLKGEGVPEQLASEHMALRRAKRVPLTDTALDTLKAEAAKAGLSLADVVRHMVQNNWVRFEAAWLNKGNSFTPTVREVTQAEAGSGGIIDPRTGRKVVVNIEVDADDIDF